MVTNGSESDLVSVPFKDVEAGSSRAATGGPFHWVAIKDKYFLVAAVAPDEGQMFGGATLRGSGKPFEGRVTTFGARSGRAWAGSASGSTRGRRTTGG